MWAELSAATDRRRGPKPASAGVVPARCALPNLMSAGPPEGDPWLSAQQDVDSWWAEGL